MGGKCLKLPLCLWNPGKIVKWRATNGELLCQSDFMRNQFFTILESIPDLFILDFATVIFKWNFSLVDWLEHGHESLQNAASVIDWLNSRGFDFPRECGKNDLSPAGNAGNNSNVNKSS